MGWRRRLCQHRSGSCALRRARRSSCWRCVSPGAILGSSLPPSFSDSVCVPRVPLSLPLFALPLFSSEAASPSPVHFSSPPSRSNPSPVAPNIMYVRTDACVCAVYRMHIASTGITDALLITHHALKPPPHSNRLGSLCRPTTRVCWRSARWRASARTRCAQTLWARCVSAYVFVFVWVHIHFSVRYGSPHAHGS